MNLFLHSIFLLTNLTIHYGAANFSWAFRQLCKPKQSLNKFNNFLVLIKASTALGMLVFQNYQIIRIYHKKTRDSMSLNESHWAALVLIETLGLFTNYVISKLTYMVLLIMTQHDALYLVVSLIMMNDWRSLLSLIFCPKMFVKIIKSRCYSKWNDD